MANYKKKYFDLLERFRDLKIKCDILKVFLEVKTDLETDRKESLKNGNKLKL